MARIGSLAQLGLHGPAWLDGHCRLAGRFRPLQASELEGAARDQTPSAYNYNISTDAGGRASIGATWRVAVH